MLTPPTRQVRAREWGTQSLWVGHPPMKPRMNWVSGGWVTRHCAWSSDWLSTVPDKLPLMDNNSIWDRAEQFTKISAGCVLAVYIVGFLVTSLYYSTLGIAPINPLRARIASAGLLFSFTVVAGYWAGIRSFDDFLKPSPESGQNQIVRLLIASCLFILLCYSLSTILWQITDFDSVGLLTVAGSYIAPVFLFTVGFTIWRIESISLRVRTIITTVMMLLVMTLFAIFSVWTREARSHSVLFGWLLLVSLNLLGGRILVTSDKFSAGMNVTTSLSQGILLLTYFAHLIFPHVRPEWGGGAPVPIVLTYSKDAGYLAGQVRPALLLDEGDLGFYLLDRNLSRTYFVPRSEVSLVAYEYHVSRWP